MPANYTAFTREESTAAGFMPRHARAAWREGINRSGRYSCLMLAALITFAHFAVSLTNIFSKSAGLPMSGVVPSAARRLLKWGQSARR